MRRGDKKCATFHLEILSLCVKRAEF